MAETSPPRELAALRRKITDLVAHNAVAMVQQAIDAVREEGQYQAMKYLFEMIGLYPANARSDGDSDDPAQDSLARILLRQLGLPDDLNVTEVSDVPARKRRHPVK